jgi:hypothetical protein
MHNICAELASKEVLKINPKDSIGLYEKLYQDCSSKKDLITFSF